MVTILHTLVDLSENIIPIAFGITGQRKNAYMKSFGNLHQKAFMSFLNFFTDISKLHTKMIVPIVSQS